MRFPSREIYIGDIAVGGNNPIRLQSMTNTDTANVKETIEQCIRIFEAGADYVRISIPTIKNIEHLKSIKSGLTKAGFKKPLIADIHFRPEIALEAAKIVEKVRINPGNYTDRPKPGQSSWTESEYLKDLEKIGNNIFPLLKICKEYGTAIRIGTNYGSLSDRIVSRYGNTPEAMVQSTIEFVRIFESFGFYNTIISLKASNPLVMIQSYSLMAQMLVKEGVLCPFHVGVTEAGEGENGRIKSAIGISTLLKEGIGDTIRVSLSENPEAELPVAKKIVEFNSLYSKNISNKEFKAPKIELAIKRHHLLEKHNAIVVSNDNPQRTYHLSEETGDAINPDILWTEDMQNIKPEKKYFAKAVLWQKNQVANVYPVFNIEVINDTDHFHEEYNIIKIRSKNDLSGTYKFDKIPNPIILADIGESITIDDVSRVCEKGISFPVIIKANYKKQAAEDLSIRLASDFGKLLLQKQIHGFWIECDGIKKETIVDIVFKLFQASGIRVSKTEFISCPTCARTSYDLLKLLKKVQSEISNIPGLKIAVMGCLVNGPGEMADADFGFIGAPNGNVNIYKGKSAVLKNIPIESATDELKKLLKKEGFI